MTDEQAREKAASNFLSEINRKYNEIEQANMPNILSDEAFKAGWTACLHGPTVTALVEAIKQHHNAWSEHHGCLAECSRLCRALAEFNKARGADE